MPWFVHSIVVRFSLAGRDVAPFGDCDLEQLEKSWLGNCEHEFSEVGSIVLLEEQVQGVRQRDVHLQFLMIELVIKGE